MKSACHRSLLVLLACLSSTAGHAVTVDGDLSYAGRQTGAVWVVANTTSNPWPIDFSTTLVSTGAYSLAALPAPTNYWFFAFRDSNGNASNDSWEAWGSYSNNPVYLTDDLTGVDITLIDPDTDRDRMPDWWEYLHFNHDFNMELLRQFNEEGIEFAFPTQTLYLKPDGEFAASVRVSGPEGSRVEM